MEILTDLYQELYEDGVFLYSGNYGLSGECDSVIVSDGHEHYGIFLDIEKIRTPIQEKMAVSHEWGHYTTGSLCAIDASDIVRAQAERRAEKAQVKKLIPKDELDAAVADGRTEPWELAEFFGVTEECVRAAISIYQNDRLT